LQLPAWRPGRYELQNFAKNIRCFNITDGDGNAVKYQKLTKDRWEIYTKGLSTILVSYEYFANQPDAGGSYLCSDFLYINPVNCMMYVEGRMDETYTLTFDLPENYELATQLHIIGKHQCTAPDFDYLADSPLIASPSLQCVSFTDDYKGKPYTVKLWFQGKHTLNLERLITDTKSYTAFQVAVMGEMPCETFHFLYLMLEKPFRHGVEHLNSTVIALGKLEDQTDEEFYNDLLAISSHELFHLWNIKRIRPAEMWPYDFTKENYSIQGYVYEGITTYLGDLFLLHSGVWNQEQYLSSLQSDLLRHFTNDGRFNYSLAESSWDTWLDGYVQGVPGRKISIYIEGLIAAWVADVYIIRNTNGKHRLYDVMRDLYKEFYLQNKGYTSTDYFEVLAKYVGAEISAYVDELIFGKGKFEHWLNRICVELGLVISFDEERKNLIIKQVDCLTNIQQKNLNHWFAIKS
jgi:predicted metalloprotease with PDZ domain